MMKEKRSSSVRTVGARPIRMRAGMESRIQKTVTRDVNPKMRTGVPDGSPIDIVKVMSACFHMPQGQAYEYEQT